MIRAFNKQKALAVNPVVPATSGEGSRTNPTHEEIEMSISIAPNGQNSQSDPRNQLHYVSCSGLTSSIVDGAPSTSLCGITDVFGSAGGGPGSGTASICPTCALLYGAIACERERAVA